MKHKMTANIGLKFLSLFLAFLIWLLVANIDNPTDSVLFKGVNIQVINADSVTEIAKTFDIISEETVVIKVTERKSVLNSLSADDFTVVAEMENLNDMTTVPLTVTCSNAAVSWNEIEMVPSSMKVKVEQRKQVEFPITVVTSGKPRNGYEVGQTEVVQGKTVQIAGPESMLNRIGQVKATVITTNIATDQRLTATLEVYDKNGDKIKEPQINRLQIKDSSGVLLTENKVMVDVTVWEIMSDVPVEINTTGSVAEGYQLTSISALPVTVSLVGTQESLARLNGKVVLKDPVNLDGATGNFTVELDISETLSEIEGLRMIADADPTITVSVQIEKVGDQTLMIPLSNLQIENRPADMTLTFSPADEIAVSVRAEEGESTIKQSDIKGKVDLAVCSEPGDYEIPVQIVLPDGYSLVSDVKLVVNAALTEQPEAVTEEAED